MFTINMENYILSLKKKVNHYIYLMQLLDKVWIPCFEFNKLFKYRNEVNVMLHTEIPNCRKMKEKWNKTHCVLKTNENR
jgi:hypothetical protein